MKNEEVATFVRTLLKEQKSGEYWDRRVKQNKTTSENKPKPGTIDLGLICEDLLDHVVQDLDSKDNVSVIIVSFN